MPSSGRAWHLSPPTSHLVSAGRERTSAFHLLGLFVIIGAEVWLGIRQGGGGLGTGSGNRPSGLGRKAPHSPGTAALLAGGADLQPDQPGAWGSRWP